MYTKELEEAIDFLYNFDSYSEYQKNLRIIFNALDFNLVRIDSLKESLDVMTNLYGNEVNKTRDLTEWLLGEKYINVDETSDNMTEEFEREHRWELSRNCFINKVVKHLEELK